MRERVRFCERSVDWTGQIGFKNVLSEVRDGYFQNL
jgi:hypothetical protein